MKKILTRAMVFVIMLSVFLTAISHVRTQAIEWFEPQQLTSDPADEYYASIMQDSCDKIWLVWVKEELGGRALWRKTSSDGGASWSTSERLVSGIPTVSGTSLFQDSTGKIWLAWGGGSTLSQDLFYINSDDCGLSWSAPQQLTSYAGDDNVPSLIEVSGEVWIVFRSYGLSHREDIWYLKTSDGGSTWSDPIQLTFEGRNYSPNAMVDSGGKIWVTWIRKVPEGDIHYITSDNNGFSWSEPEPLTNTPEHEDHTSIIEDVSDKISIFYGFTGVTKDILYRTTVDEGDTWSDPQPLTDDPNYNNHTPYAALIDNEVWVIWVSDRSGNSDIWMSKIAPVPAAIDTDPDTLNLKSNGEWITVYIELPEDYSVSDIDPNSILLNGTISVDAEGPVAVGDYDLDNIPDLMVKFDRAAIIEWLNTNDYGEDTGKYYEINLTITGTVSGTQFAGTDQVRVLKR